MVQCHCKALYGLCASGVVEVVVLTVGDSVVDSEAHAAVFVAHRKLGTERQYEWAAVKRPYGFPATAGAPANSSP